MTEREKVIADLKLSKASTVDGYSAHHYGGEIHGITTETLCDALTLLKAQEPRVMTLSGVRNLKENTPVWLEDVDKADVIGALFMRDYSGTKCVDFAIVRDWAYERVTADYMDYGIRWRCWTSEPTKEQREATPWSQTNGL